MAKSRFKEEKFIVDLNLLRSSNIGIEQFLVLLLYKARGTESLENYLKTLTNELLKKNLLVPEFFNNEIIHISPKGREFVDQIILESQGCNIEENLEELANKLKELFPPGNKSPGHPWRGNTKEIVNKLKRFKTIYSYSDTEILNATKHYVENMENNLYMRVLKYFILKQNNGGEEISDLASYIENADEQIRNDWAMDLKGTTDGE